jgi:hypothetical protein
VATSWSARCKKLRDMSPLYEMAKEGIEPQDDIVGGALTSLETLFGLL